MNECNNSMNLFAFIFQDSRVTLMNINFNFKIFQKKACTIWGRKGKSYKILVIAKCDCDREVDISATMVCRGTSRTGLTGKFIGWYNPIRTWPIASHPTSHLPYFLFDPKTRKFHTTHLVKSCKLPSKTVADTLPTIFKRERQREPRHRSIGNLSRFFSIYIFYIWYEISL